MTDTEWVSDENGNRCSVAYFGSTEAAQAALDSLKDCTNCTNCSDCSDCSDCWGCWGCWGCWAARADGESGGTKVCTRCGITSFSHAMRYAP